MSDEQTARSDAGLSFSTPGDVVRWMRQREDARSLVENCYWDENSTVALRRFAGSEEFHELLCIFRNHGINPGSRLLDLGAGNGVVSHAFGSVGYNVVAVEPDRCPIVGNRALASLNARVERTVPIIAAIGQALPFQDHIFDVVYCRQVLHHIRDLHAAVTEVHRLLRPGGLFLATREHVVSDDQQLQRFLSAHPIHQLVGGENAYRLDEYVNAISSAGFDLIETIGPDDSIVNFFPMSIEEWKRWCSSGLRRRFGVLGIGLARFGPIQRAYGRFASTRDQRPGRLYSFAAIA